jgi:hypothetical protein
VNESHDECTPTDNPAECSEEQPRNHGWFKASRGPEPMELIASNPLCYVLAAVIAHRARWSNEFNRHGLQMGEALLGDFAQYGMSERQYRTCKENLQKWGFATFRTTNRGTIGKLCDSRLFAVSKFVTDGQNDSRSDRRPTDDRRTTDGRGTTNQEPLRRAQMKKETKNADTVSGKNSLGANLPNSAAKEGRGDIHADWNA